MNRTGHQELMTDYPVRKQVMSHPQTGAPQRFN